MIKRYKIKPILFLIYEYLLFGLFELEAILSKLKERYYWSKIKNEIKSYI